DYQLAREEFIPVVEMLYGLQCSGDFARLARFTHKQNSPSIGLSSLVRESLAVAETDLAGMVIVAESPGLVGAALRRSPASIAPSDGGTPSDLFAHPEVREWLSFTPERVHRRSLALVVGVAARMPLRTAANGLSAFLRPLGAAGDLAGHFHAA